jgi:hypothetical protein
MNERERKGGLLEMSISAVITGNTVHLDPLSKVSSHKNDPQQRLPYSRVHSLLCVPVILVHHFVWNYYY